MAKSAALNPASMPFFPGGLRNNAPDDETAGSTINLGFTTNISSGQKAFHGQDRGFFSSSNTIPSSSDFRSMRSTPSPPQQQQQLEGQTTPAVRQQSPSVLEPDNPRHSPTFRQSDAQKAYPALESRIVREASLFGTLGTLPEKDERSYAEEDEPITTPGSATYSAARQQQPQQQQVSVDQSTSFLPFALTNAGRSSSYSSISPVPSSQESNNRATPVIESPGLQFEAQLRTSPLIQDILDRIIRCEYASREIQQDLSDLNRKVNILIERAVSQPEFNDPFAPAPSHPSLQSRPSFGNIAPNQAATSDDISSISQRLNTLTSSVGQLLALQTQQMQQQSLTSPVTEGRNSIISLNNSLDLLPHNQMLIPPSAATATSSSILSHHTLQGRQDSRLSSSRQHTPNPNSRIWPSGNLDHLRSSSQEGGHTNKRRSSGLARRDSTGVSVPSYTIL